MNYGRIRRGPMAADAFTQIRNALFRDPRLSFRDKGVFGLISTHRDGFGISAEAIAACSPTDGLTAVKTSLRNLERCGYLQRTRERRKNGTLGSAVYFITDQPEAFGSDPETESGRSKPVVAQPTLAEPTQAEPAVAEPTVAELPHKKTSSKNTSGKKTLSPRLPRQARQQPPAAPKERENPATPINDQAQQVAAAWQQARGGRRNPSAEKAIAQSAAELLAADWPLADLTALAQDMAAKYPTGRDLTRHADHWQPPAPIRPSVTPDPPVALPPWCEDLDCDEHTRWRLTTNQHGFTYTGPCPDCHPDAHKDIAA